MDSYFNKVLSIMKNGASQCKSTGNGAGPGDFNSASCSIALELLAGDEVFVVSDNGHPVGSGGFSGFSGFIIKAYQQ